MRNLTHSTFHQTTKLLTYLGLLRLINQGKCCLTFYTTIMIIIIIIIIYDVVVQMGCK